MVFSVKKKSAYSLPQTAQFFQEELFRETLHLCTYHLPMQQIVDIMVLPEVCGYKLVETQRGKSFEGQNLTGAKLIVELSIKEKLVYIADNNEQTIHSLNYQQFSSTYVMLPQEYRGYQISDLVESKAITISAYVEGVDILKLCPQSAHFAALLLVDVSL